MTSPASAAASVRTAVTARPTSDTNNESVALRASSPCRTAADAASYDDGTPCSLPVAAAVPAGAFTFRFGATYFDSTGGGVLLDAGVGTITFIFFVTLTACHDACKAGDEIAVRSKTSPAVPTAVPSDAISIARRRRERRIMPFERRLPARRDTSTLSADWIIKPPPRFSRVGNDAV